MALAQFSTKLIWYCVPEIFTNNKVVYDIISMHVA